MPPGGEEYYYTVYSGNYAYIDLRMNGEVVCAMYDDNTEVSDYSNGVCNAVVLLAEGKSNSVFYK